MTLALIAMAGLVLVGLARYSLSVSAEVRRARNDLQGRWGTKTLSQCLLIRSEHILQQQADSEALAKSTDVVARPFVQTLQLGELEFRIVLDDESRKLNVNRLYVTGGSDEVYLAAHDLGLSGHWLSLNPSPSRVGNSRYRPYDSWGQVFALDEVSLGEPIVPWLQTRTADITCWGDGRIHFASASDNVLHLAALRAAGPITATQLVTLRRRNPELSLKEVLDQLDTRHDAKARLKGWLRDRANCFSLWITAEAEGYRTAELHIAGFTSRDSVEINRFAW